MESFAKYYSFFMVWFTRTRVQEDDGLGGRRKKKGITAKIKEKLPGHHQATGTTTTATAYDTTGTGVIHHQKKGMLEKIKEKLPGAHHH